MAAENFNVWFYNFNKKVNSTRTPVVGTPGLQYEVHTCYLRSPSSVIHPILEMAFDRSAVPTGSPPQTSNGAMGEAFINYNYCEIGRFNRYYFIDNIEWNDGFLVFYLTCDVLGSWKKYIGNYTGLILRCSDSTNPMLYDSNMYVGSVTAASKESGEILSDTVTYVVGTTFASSNSVGGITYLVGTGSVINGMLTALMTPGGWVDNQGERADDDKFVNLNVQAAIKSCVSLLVKMPTGATTKTKLVFNGYQTVGEYYVLSKTHGDTENTEVVVPKHPSYSPETSIGLGNMNYTLFSPFSEYTLHLPCVGDVTISSYDIPTTQHLDISYKIDYVNGIIAYNVYNINNVMGTYQGYCGAGGGIGGTQSTGAVAATSQASDVIGVVGGLATAGIGAAALLIPGAQGAAAIGIAAGMSMVAGGTISAAQSATSAIQHGAATTSNKTNAITASGSFVHPSRKAVLMATFRSLTGGDSTTCGRPYGKSDTVKNHTGYLQIKNPSVDVPTNSEELTAINQYLASGFYYEEEI